MILIDLNGLMNQSAQSAQTVVVAVSGGSGAPAVGTMNVMPIKLQGKITSGSKTVEIG